MKPSVPARVHAHVPRSPVCDGVDPERMTPHHAGTPWPAPGPCEVPSSGPMATEIDLSRRASVPEVHLNRTKNRAVGLSKLSGQRFFCVALVADRDGGITGMTT